MLQDESNPDFVVEVVSVFFDDSERILNDLYLTLNDLNVDFKKVDAHVHQLKGSSSSFPMDISTFSQIDTTHWILDMNTFVGDSYHQVKELCIFLLNGLTLPVDKALAVYIQSPGSSFLYSGAVTISRPSTVLTLPWPDPAADSTSPPQLTATGAPPLSAKIGVSVRKELESRIIGAQRVKNACVNFRGFCERQDVQSCRACLQQVKQEYFIIKENLQKLLMMEQQIVSAGGSIPPMDPSSDYPR
ncbi:hypothetical protein V2J09_017759 [Rumex salicifolius]